MAEKATQSSFHWTPQTQGRSGIMPLRHERHHRSMQDNLARLCRLFPGVSVEEARKITGFRVTLAPEVKTVDPSIAEEMEILRTRVDLTGILRR